MPSLPTSLVKDSPSFFLTVPERKPRTECARQPVNSTSARTEAPFVSWRRFTMISALVSAGFFGLEVLGVAGATPSVCGAIAPRALQSVEAAFWPVMLVSGCWLFILSSPW